jgi:MOSC domain-containing protein YiiM
VHLIGIELHEELAGRGLVVAAGEMGENALTQGVDLLGLSTGTIVRLGDTAVLELAGLRNPCGQLDDVRPGLMAAVLERADDGQLVPRAGVMAVVRVTGEVRPGDTITIERPSDHRSLRPV